MPGRPLPQGTGALYSLEPVKGGAGGRFEGLGCLSLMRPRRSHRKVRYPVAEYRICPELSASGFDFTRSVSRVAEVMGISQEQVTAFGKSPQTVKARSLLCFWAHWKLGMSTAEIAMRIDISQPAASRSSKRGEQIAKENQFELIPRKV
jgi:predicted transcriptional regulator